MVSRWLAVVDGPLCARVDLRDKKLSHGRMAGGYGPGGGGNWNGPGQYGAPPPQAMVQVYAAPIAGWACPFCRYAGPAQFAQKISTGGWIVFAVMLLVCFPLFWIGLLMKDNVPRCPNCGALSR
jgi:hypothetical protein